MIRRGDVRQALDSMEEAALTQGMITGLLEQFGAADGAALDDRANAAMAKLAELFPDYTNLEFVVFVLHALVAVGDQMAGENNADKRAGLAMINAVAGLARESYIKMGQETKQ